MTAADTTTEAPAAAPASAEFWIKSTDLTRILSNTLMFASTDDVFPVLNAVQVIVSGALPEGTEPGGQTGRVQCKSTDRYTIGMDHAFIEPPTADVEFLLSGRDAKGLLKLLPKNSQVKVSVTVPTAEWEIPKITVETFAGPTVTYEGVQGSFPNVEALIPSEFAAVEAIGINPALLLRFTKVDPGTGQRKHTLTAAIRFQGPVKPALVTMGETFIGAIMPVRLSSTQEG